MRVRHWPAYFAVRIIALMIRVLPFSAITLLSDAMAWFMLRILNYRTSVARSNLLQSFPEWDDRHVRALLPAVYHNITDVFLETVKAFSIPPAGLLSRISHPDETQIAEWRRHYRGAIIVTAHLGNWEWAGYCLTTFLEGQGIAVYRPLHNPLIDKLMKKHRMQSGLQIIAMREIVRLLSHGASSNHYVLLIADQNPGPDAHWVQFLGRRTAFHKGPAVLAHRYDMPVFYLGVRRQARHRYGMFLEPLCTDPATLDPLDITALYAQRIEVDIRERPAAWLWTHRRWKHRPQDTSNETYRG